MSKTVNLTELRLPDKLFEKIVCQLIESVLNDKDITNSDFTKFTKVDCFR